MGLLQVTGTLVAKRQISTCGWRAKVGAFPAFYTSMSEAEIRRFKAAAASAERKRRGIWAGYAAKLSLDRALRYGDAQGSLTSQAAQSSSL
jgi:endonuclease YncB( thermonuclease family)